MATSPKNIRYYFRSVNYQVDEYLRSLIKKFPRTLHHTGAEQSGAIASDAKRHSERSEESPRPPKDPIATLQGDMNIPSRMTTDRERFIAITKAELQRGNDINKILTDPPQLFAYVQNCQRRIIEQMRREGFSDAKIVRAITYLLDIASRKQKCGKRGVLKSRPVVYERVFTSLCPEGRYDPQFQYRLGAIIEIYNRATYAIDDVFDDSDFRAGEPTLHKVFTKTNAILVGQYLHLWSLELLLNELTNVSPHIRAEVIRSFNIIHTSIYQMEIENYDLQEKLRTDSDFRMHYLRQPLKKKTEYYLTRVNLRTGKFYEYIARIAVLLATHDFALAHEWQPYGLGLGFRYLIDNDLKDLIDPYYVKSGTGSLGLKGKAHKSFMGDLEVGKITYPVLVALENDFDKRIIRMIGRKLSLEEKNEITSFIINNGGVDATMKLMEHYADMSKQILKKLGVTEPTLWELTELHKFSKIPFEKFIENKPRGAR